MKSIHYYISLALLFGLMACSSDYDDVASYAQVQLSGSIEGQSRAVNKSSWAPSDAVGVFLAKTATPLDPANAKYVTLTGDGSFTPDTDADAIRLKAVDGAMTLCAYYPYDASITNHVYRISSWDNNGTDPRLDLLWGTVGCSSERPDAFVQFRHLFTKLMFTVEVANVADNPYSDLTASDLEGMTIQAANMNYPVSVNLMNGNVTLESRSGGAIGVPYSHGTGELIFAPEASNHGHRGRTITFRLRRGTECTWHIDDAMTFASGHAYSYRLKLSSAKTEVEAVLNGSIVDWTAHDMGEIPPLIAN